MQMRHSRSLGARHARGSRGGRDRRVRQLELEQFEQHDEHDRDDGNLAAGQPASRRSRSATRTSPRSSILGQLYAQALRAKGYTVNLKENIGATEVIDKALTSGQIQMYPEYTGTILSVIANQTTPPKTRLPPTRGEGVRGGPRLHAARRRRRSIDSDAIAVLPAYAKKNG